MKNFRLLLFFLSLAFDVSAQLQKESSFENPMPANYNGCCNASYAPFGCIEGVDNTYSHQISTLYKRSGNSSWRTELRPGGGTVCYGSYRTEITMIPKGSAVATGANCFGISVYIPASAAAWVNLTQSRVTGIQSHPWSPGTTNGSPNWSIHTKAGRWVLYVVHTGSNTANNAPENFLQPFDLGPVTYDVWTDWEVYCNNLKTTAGRIIVNKITNGVRENNKGDYKGYALHGFSEWPFIKIGTYDWAIPSTGPARIVYYDMARYGKGTPENFSSVIGLPGAPAPTPNIKPIVTPTPPTMVVNSATVAGIKCTSIDPDGTIVSKLWTQTSGPNSATITPTNADSATVSGLVIGYYTFLHTVTDNQGATSSAAVSVTVNQSPEVDLSANVTFKFSDTTTQINILASGSDADGTIVSYKWLPVTGPNTPVFSPDNAANTTVLGLIPGSYTIRLTITDNHGAEGAADYSFTIQTRYIISRFGVKKHLPPSY